MMHPNDYINESREWFCKRYLTPAVDTVKIMILLMAIIISLNIVWAIVHLTTQTTIMRFPIYVDNTDDSNHVIKNIFDPKKTIDEVFARYMLIRYITLRESYAANLLEPSVWKDTLLNISSMSSNKVFDEFLNEVLPSKNSDSPIIKYRFSTSIEPVINSIQFTQLSGKKPIAATVEIQTLECNYKYRNCLSRNFNIDIEFEINAYPRFRFRIQDYCKSPIINTTS